MPRPKKEKESSETAPARKKTTRKVKTPQNTEAAIPACESADSPASAPTSAPKVEPISPAERHRMIAEAAYYLALKKGPQSDPHENWLEAEAQIDARLRAEGRL